MNAPGETNHSTAGINEVTRPPTAKRRLVGFTISLLVAIGIVGALNRGTTHRMAQLEAEFATIESERFLLGLHAREALARMNGALLRFQLSGDNAARDVFRSTQFRLEERLAQTGGRLDSVAEQAALQKFKTAYGLYLTNTAELIERAVRGVRKGTATEVQQLIQEHSGPAAEAAEELVLAQQAAWTDFFAQSRRILSSLQGLMLISAATLLVLLALLAALAHRAFIAPLRVQLSETQAVIERQEKLASLGTLAAGVAHEIRNPLTAIKMRLFSLKKALPPAVAQSEDLAVVHAEINRLERIVKDTLQFARPGEPVFDTMDPAEPCREVDRLLADELRKRNIVLHVDAQNDLRVRADRQQLLQVLINLIRNAAESIEREGDIRMATRSGVARIKEEPEPVVLIDVMDTGKGIPTEVERRLFDPFFSTKEGGTGLGLPIAARIVEKHGGVIQYSRHKNRGTTFTIVLPRLTNNESTSAAD